jgi:thiol:disulfide interchange protein DsbG
LYDPLPTTSVGVLARGRHLAATAMHARTPLSSFFGAGVVALTLLLPVSGTFAQEVRPPAAAPAAPSAPPAPAAAPAPGTAAPAAAAPRAAPKSPVDPRFARLERARAIVEGPKTDPKAVLYVLFDPNCFYCNLTWRAVQPYEKVGLQVRWVPVAYQQRSSVGRAAAIVRAPDPVEAFRRNEANYDRSRYEGGIEPMQSVPHGLAASFAANNSLMHAFRSPATPVLVWKDRSGAVQVKAGVPKLSELPAITGLPAQPNDDPALADFR